MKYKALDCNIKKEYDKRFVKSMVAIDDLLLRKRYLYDLSETNGDMLALIKLLNDLHEKNEELEAILIKINKENQRLKKDLYECEKSYIYDTNEFSIDIEKDMKDLEKEYVKWCNTNIDINELLNKW